MNAPSLKVLTKVCGASLQEPQIEINMSNKDFYAISVAKAGFFGGSPLEVKKAPIGEVLKVLEFERFMTDYDRASYELNKPNK